MAEPSTHSHHLMITGASSGIGFEAALLLVRRGHRLTLPCRDAATGEATRQRLMDGAGVDVAPVPATPVCDLADLESIAACSAALLEARDPIDGLVLNAGLQYAGAGNPRFSAQGLELTIAVNHLGHQALCQRLLPLLDLSPAPRVVVTGSEVHDPEAPGGRVGRPASLGDLAGLRPEAASPMLDGVSRFNAEKAYKDSKLCNLLFARELERRLRKRGTPMAVLAWSPGLVIPRQSGGFFRYSRTHNEPGQRLFALVARDLLRITASPAQAGALLAGLATDPEDAEPGFRYRSNRVRRPGQLSFEPTQPSTDALDDGLARTLWDLSATRIGLPADLPPPG